MKTLKMENGRWACVDGQNVEKELLCCNETVSHCLLRGR